MDNYINDELTYADIITAFLTDLEDILGWIKVDVDDFNHYHIKPMVMTQVFDGGNLQEHMDSPTPDWMYTLWDCARRAGVELNYNTTAPQVGYYACLTSSKMPYFSKEDPNILMNNPMSRILFELEGYHWDRDMDDLALCLSDPSVYNKTLVMGYLLNCVEYYQTLDFERRQLDQ